VRCFSTASSSRPASGWAWLAPIRAHIGVGSRASAHATARRVAASARPQLQPLKLPDLPQTCAALDLEITCRDRPLATVVDGEVGAEAAVNASISPPGAPFKFCKSPRFDWLRWPSSESFTSNRRQRPRMAERLSARRLLAAMYPGQRCHGHTSPLAAFCFRCMYAQFVAGLHG